MRLTCAPKEENEFSAPICTQSGARAHLRSSALISRLGQAPERTRTHQNRSEGLARESSFCIRSRDLRAFFQVRARSLVLGRERERKRFTCATPPPKSCEMDERAKEIEAAAAKRRALPSLFGSICVSVWATESLISSSQRQVQRPETEPCDFRPQQVCATRERFAMSEEWARRRAVGGQTNVQLNYVASKLAVCRIAQTNNGNSSSALPQVSPVAPQNALNSPVAATAAIARAKLLLARAPSSAISLPLVARGNREKDTR